jgi:hypothetical protein
MVDCALVRGEPDRSQAGVVERLCRPLHEGGGILGRSTLAVERGEVVVGEQLAVVLGAAERVDPLSRTAMALGPTPAWNLVVGDVAKKLVAEGIFHVACDRRAARPLNELPPHERLQKRFGVPARDAADRLECAGPEDLADDGGVLEQLFLDVGQRVQPRRNDPLQGLRQLLEPAVLDQHATQLLRVERVAADAREQRLVRLGRGHRLREHRSDQSCRLALGQRQ